MKDYVKENSDLRFLCRELGSAIDGLVSIRGELRLAEGVAPGSILYIDRLFREAEEALERARKAGIIRGSVKC